MKKTVMMILFAFIVVFASCDEKEDVKPVDEFAEIKAKLSGRWVMEYIELNDSSIYTRDFVCSSSTVPEYLLGWVNDFTFTYVDGIFTRYVCDNDINMGITYQSDTEFTTRFQTSYQKYQIITSSANQIKLRLINNNGRVNDGIQNHILLNKEE